MLWWDSSGTGLYIRYNDGNSSQWVRAENQVGTGGPFLPLAGGTMTGPLNYAPSNPNTVTRSAQDRAGQILYAEDYGVIPGAPDNTAALQVFLSALQAAGSGYKGVLPRGWIYFTAPLTFANVQHWTLEGAGTSTTWLVYKGASTTVDILTISGCANFRLGGFHLDSNTVMTAGTGLHISNGSHGFLTDIMVGGQSGATHIGGDSNLHYNLWNGLWFDKVDFITLSNFEAAGQNDGVRLNGAVGSGFKADMLMQFGKIMGCVVGLRVGGAFGGLLADNIDVIGNWHNFVIDQSLAAEFNRENFLGPHAVFDSSGALSSPTVPGPAAQGGVGDNILINDPNGGFLVIKGWASAAGGGGSNIHVVAWSGTINIDGCLIPYASADGIRIDTTVPTVIVSPTTQLHGNAGYGINQTVAMNPVIGSPRLFSNTAGALSPTTQLQAGAAIGNGNTCIGSMKGYPNVTGSNNTIVGFGVATNSITGSGNVYIGSTGVVAIGPPSESNTLRIGGTGTNIFAVTGINGSTPQMYLTWLQQSPSYANDAAAAAGGVGVGVVYRNGSQVMVRIA